MQALSLNINSFYCPLTLSLDATTPVLASLLLRPLLMLCPLPLQEVELLFDCIVLPLCLVSMFSLNFKRESFQVLSESSSLRGQGVQTGQTKPQLARCTLVCVRVCVF